MRYISTRGQAPALSFEEVVLTGMASDGGLYVPESIPQLSRDDLAEMAGLSYAEIAFRVMQPFVNGEIDDDTFRGIVEEAYATFSHDAVVPLNQLDANHFLLELFHGPTLAFKDVALQLLGRILDHFLKKRGERAVIMGATSGDTGSAAIEGCRHCDNLDIFILHPYQRVSEVQRRQMTSVLADNVFNVAIEGNFDDAQAMVKASFADQSFLNGTRLVAVNSINWARIMAQIVYYVASAVALGAPHRKVSFCVPSANFGNVFAGYMAYRMGLPVERFVIATNANDILHRTLAANDFSKQELKATLAPSMDIVVSSNFERLLFEAYDRDGAAVAALLALIGYSVNDKVVVFDRIRENLRQTPDMPMLDLLNQSISSTLTRPVFNSVTTFRALLPMGIAGGAAVSSFALPMLFGIVIGTSSSVFIASPILYYLSERRTRKGLPQLRPSPEEIRAQLELIP